MYEPLTFPQGFFHSFAHVSVFLSEEII